MRKYVFGGIDPAQIADLRENVGWNRMEDALRREEMANLIEIGFMEGERLIGYLCVVSNRATDAYIQDVMVHPEYQGQGIGTGMMHLALASIREKGIPMVSVIYGDESLRPFYEKFGFQYTHVSSLRINGVDMELRWYEVNRETFLRM